MQTVLIVIHLIIVLSLVVVVLLQRSEGGALGIGGGGGFMAGRSQSNPLTRLTAYLAAGFFVTSLALTVYAGYGGGSVFDRLQPAPATNQPAAGGPSAPLGTGQGGILPQLQKIQSQTQGAGAPPQPNAAAEPPQPSFSVPSANEAPAAQPQTPAAPQATPPAPEQPKQP